MHPILFSIGPFTLKTYGLMVALGFAVSIYLAWKQAQREQIDSDAFLDMTVWIVLGGILGARLLYVIVSWHEFAENPWDVFKIWQGGLVFYGGLFMAILAVILYCRKRKLSIWQLLDVCAPYAALGHAIGRLGCFFNGCCYGPVNTTWGIVFPSLGDNVPHLPTQLIASGANIILFLGLIMFRSKRRLSINRERGFVRHTPDFGGCAQRMLGGAPESDRRGQQNASAFASGGPAVPQKAPRFTGQLICLYVLGYAILRFGLEFLRGDEIRGSVVFSWLHTSQFIALLAMGLAGWMLFRLGRTVIRKP